VAIEADKERRILDCARELFARYGYKKTSIDQIADCAGVGKGTVYLVARSKDDLFFQVVHSELREWVAQVSRLIDPRVEAPELLGTCSLQSFHYLIEKPLVRELLLGNYDEVLPMWESRLNDLREIGRSHIREILELGVRQGHFRPDLDIPGVARLLQDIQVMGLVLAYRGRHSLDDQLRSSQLGLDLVLNGLRRR
jgi:TetR/AcrR family fatty acid metabolism transcriptional regulator